MSLSFSQVQVALGFVAGIAPDKASAFQSRLKQWQKMGFPEGVNVGRGVKASYGATQTYQLMFMLKLLRVGLTPERAQNVVLAAWEPIKDAIVETVICLANRADHQHYCFIRLDALSDLKPGASDHNHVFVELFTGDQIVEAFLPSDDEWADEDKQAHELFGLEFKNTLAISITVEVDSMLIMLWAALAAGGVPGDVFADEMADWYQQRTERGRVAQENASHYDTNLAAKSIATHTTEFDVAGAAKAALSKANLIGSD